MYLAHYSVSFRHAMQLVLYKKISYFAALG